MRMPLMTRPDRPRQRPTLMATLADSVRRRAQATESAACVTRAVLLLMALLLLPAEASANNTSAARITVVHSHVTGMPETDILQRSILHALREAGSTPPVDLHTLRAEDIAAGAGLPAVGGDTRQLVITLGEPAFDWMLRQVRPPDTQWLFADVCAALVPNPVPPDAGGLIRQSGISDTLALIRRWHPDAGELSVIGDHSACFAADLARLRDANQRLPQPFSIQVFSGASLDLTLENIALLSTGNDVVLLMGRPRDWLDNEIAPATIAGRTHAILARPVYVTDDAMIGHGVLGGSVNGVHASAGPLADAVMAWLSAAPDNEPPGMTVLPPQRIIDQLVRKQYGLSEQPLPPDTRLINDDDARLFEQWFSAADPALHWDHLPDLVLMAIVIAIGIVLPMALHSRHKNLARMDQQLILMNELMEAMPFPVFFKDQQLRYRRFNRAFEAFLKLPRERIINRTVAEVAEKPLAATYDDKDRALLAAGGQQIYESQVVQSDGTRRDVMFRKAVVSDPRHGSIGIVGAIIDITEERARAQRLELLSRAFTASASAMLIADPARHILSVNEAMRLLFGRRADELENRSMDDLLTPASRERVLEHLARDGYCECEIEASHRNGRTLICHATCSWVVNDHGERTHLVASLIDITSQRAAEQALQHRMLHDPLTGLPNRAHLELIINELSQSEDPAAAIVINLAGFKLINDTMGLQTGDALLRAIARRLDEQALDSDFVGHLGSDEFIVVLRERAGDALRRAEQILANIARPLALGDQQVIVTAYAGVSIHPGDASHVGKLLRHASAALDLARAAGPGSARAFDRAIDTAARDRARLTEELRTALSHNQLYVLYQPKVDAITRRICGAEALMRWAHPERGEVSPAVFIPLAEHSGQIATLGRWMMNEAMAQLARWREAGFSKMRMAINLSAPQLLEPDLPREVMMLLDRHDLPPELIELEVTESMAMREPEAARTRLMQLRDTGICISMDDFGTGYSSLAQLQSLPLDVMKIDRAFVRDIESSTANQSIARTIISLAQCLGLTTVAEGVETEAQERLLRDYGCNLFQGYLFGKPMPAAQLESLLDTQRRVITASGEHPESGNQMAPDT